MSFFFGGGGAKVKPQYTGIQLQTSSSTQAIALVWGMNRIAPNIFWYSDFQSHKQKQKAGKGFGGSATSYTYSASIMLGLCQGPIAGLGRVFRDQDKTTDYASLGFSLFLGEQGQAPWGYLTSKHPDQAFSYSNVAYVAAANYDLGASASTPQHSFEVKGMRYNSGPLSNGDADCALVVQDLLTHEQYGAGFVNGTLDLVQLLSSGNATTAGDGTYQTYCRARGFGINPALSSQESAGNILDRWTELTDTAVVWTGYSLKLIPYGTEVVEGNGYRFVPNVTAIYNLSDDDYLAEQGQAPLKVTRSDPSDANNALKLTVRNRDNEYNDAPVEWKDQGLIDVHGIRQGNNVDASEICSLDMGSLIVSLIGQRLAYTRNTYDFTLPPTFCLMEPMDILILQDPQLGEVAVWIEDLEEQDDYSWRVTAKEIPPGIAHAAVAQDISNNPINTSADPGPVNTPLIFQPPLDVTGGTPQIWAAVSGGDDTDANPLWGGANVYVSTDGDSFNQIGQIDVPARQGILSSTLASFSGTNPDTAHTLQVNLSKSSGDLQSVSTDEASRNATLSYVDGELISFETATLTGTSEYDVSSLYRGLYGTAASSHASGTSFARLDDAIFKYTLPQDYVGLPLYFKFQSYNIWGGGVQDLADCVEYTYTPGGIQPGTPQNLKSQLGNTQWKGGTLTVSCDPVSGGDTYTAEFYSLGQINPKVISAATGTSVTTSPNGYKITKTASGDGWDASAKSAQGFSSNASVKAVAPSSTANYIIWGLSSNPSASDSYTDVDFGFYFSSGGGLEIYESGTARGSFGTWSPGEVFWIVQSADGTSVTYYRGSSLLSAQVVRTVSTTPHTLYFDCSIYNSTGNFEASFTQRGLVLRRTVVNSLPSVAYQSIEAAADGPARIYQVRMKAVRAGVEGAWSGFTQFTNVAPPAVTGATGVGGTTTGGVSFDLLPADDDLAGYVLYYNNISGFDPMISGIPVQNNGYSPVTIYGLPAGTYYARIAGFDNWTQRPDLLNLSAEVSFTVSAGGGSSTPGGGGGGYCVVSNTMILMANGEYRCARDLVVGDMLWTRPELEDGTLGDWGSFAISAIEFADSNDVWQVVFNGNELEATGDHRVWIGTGWVKANQFGTPIAGTFEIAKITVDTAHTYISAGILSHNIKQNEANFE